MGAAITSVFGAILNIIGFGLSSFGAYRVLTINGVIENIPVIEQALNSLPL